MRPEREEMVKVKVCGITSHEDAHMAVSLGVDALGFIFAPSPRRIMPEEAGEIISRLPPFVKAVGVFVNEDEATIREIRKFCGLDLVQLHGDEPPEFCEALMPFSIKSFQVRGLSSLEGIHRYKGKIRAVLLDAYSPATRGGTGKPFDWTLASKAKAFEMPLILSGGLNPDNVRQAVKIVGPYALDLNSGVESRPGRKSRELLERCMENFLLKEVSYQ